MFLVLSHSIPASPHQLFALIGDGMPCVMGKVFGGVLYTILRILLRRDLPVIGQICSRVLGTAATDALSSTLMSLWVSRVLIFGMMFTSHPKRGRRYACPKAKVPSPGFVVMSL